MKITISVLAVWAVLIIGWFMNIYKFATLDFDRPYKAEIIRGIGIPIGFLGAVTGYIDINDGN